MSGRAPRMSRRSLCQPPQMTDAAEQLHRTPSNHSRGLCPRSQLHHRTLGSGRVPEPWIRRRVGHLAPRRDPFQKGHDINANLIRRWCLAGRPGRGTTRLHDQADNVCPERAPRRSLRSWPLPKNGVDHQGDGDADDAQHQGSHDHAQGQAFLAAFEIPTPPGWRRGAQDTPGEGHHDQSHADDPETPAPVPMALVGPFTY